MSQLTYRDGRFWKDGEPFFLVAAEYPYFRERPSNWDDRLTKLRDAGVNTITFYFCWRHHLREENGQRWYDFTGKTKESRNVAGFIKKVAEYGLYMIIKPGPFIHSETNIGGLPDLVSPSFNPGMPPARRHHGKPCYWSYDASQLPAPFDENYDALVKEWLLEVRKIIAPWCGPGKPVIALQPNDETMFCTSNDPPWHIGYEPSGIRYYQGLLAQQYGDISNFNRTHGTSYASYDYVPGPKLNVLPAGKTVGADGQPAGPRTREDLLRYVDWADYQWHLRRDLYVRYKEWLDIDLPFLTNYAGITPPIQENVPDAKEHASEQIPADYARLYAEWWFAMNRVDQDAKKDCEYGMISWLGVASYDRGVFDRYINTARRGRGINMEENWGFGTLYDAKSRYPLVPFFQTLASVAGGSTGYVIFTGVNTEYWDETLDKTTKLQCNTFPSHAPIDEHGNCSPMYFTAKMLNRWFVEHGQAFLKSELDIDSAYLLYAPYAAVSSWVPDERYWGIKDHDIPRCGHQGFEEFSTSLQGAGCSFAMFELEAASDEQLKAPRSLAIQSAFFMGAAEQEKLAKFIEGGGKLFISGELPSVDLEWKPCTRLRVAVEKAGRDFPSRVIYRRDNLFADGKFAQRLAEAGITPNVTYQGDLRAYVYRGQNEYFVFFFGFEQKAANEASIDCYGIPIKLRLGSKTSGVLRISNGKLAAYLVKGENEVEGIKSKIRIQVGDQVVEQEGDFSSVG